METKCWIVDKEVDNKTRYPQIEEAAQALRLNEVVAFPTETVYGLGANALSDEAIAKIYEAKGRPSDNPLIVHIADTSQLEPLIVDIPEKAKRLMEAFWPGPLTIIFKKMPGRLSEKATAGMDTVGIRMPDHPVALKLISACGLPIAAPSANRSGKPSPTSAKHVWDDLAGKIAGVVDGGETGVGVESTVLDCTVEPPVILRPGGLSKEEIEDVIGHVEFDPALKNKDSKPKAPGMKYTHYAPNAPLYLVEGPIEKIQQLADAQRSAGKKVGILTTEENSSSYDADIVLSCGKRSELSTVAHELYGVLRQFNETEVDIIYSEVFPNKGIGAAVMNRLEKAAGHKWIR
ncbi:MULTISPECIES: L-threonylcarbamoyladenylate synthase [Bacillus]|jgi:L-threonylcarbamoyladenylate synthase|uniref:L-threonylcarbamoyladenylate synthase n=1 Tax=Bacillus TaxID=1386 RepID=UPI002E210A0F|nr:L-threonylcarbamoyladenylate synthase [Bacillus smithii]MED1456481.1 L-threonylcarbamoyladenylate synthase [Bacillus smithii]MED1489617.1 L-threonylcarbamoyladenylate synthase [Bacillus smithii]